MGILADEVISQSDDARLSKLYRDPTTNCRVDRWLLPKITKARYIDTFKYKIQSNTESALASLAQGETKSRGKNVATEFREERSLIVEAVETISDEELIEAFVWPDIYIRQSTWELFHRLDLPNNVICCECKLGGGIAEMVRKWLATSKLPNVFGLDQSFQCGLLSKVGAHYMGIQFLASWLKNWTFVCIAGSANLFAIMPVKGIIMYDIMYKNVSTENCLRGLAQRRYGSLGNEIPVFLPLQPRFNVAGYLDSKKEILSESVERLRSYQYGGSRSPSGKIRREIVKETLLDHAGSPFHHGECSGATHAGRCENPSCGDSSQIEIRVDEACRIKEAWFQTQGCMITRAGGSMLVELLQGMALQDASRLTQTEILALLDSPLTPHRQMCFLLTFFAFRRALDIPMKRVD